jgi:hypothetical protein
MSFERSRLSGLFMSTLLVLMGPFVKGTTSSTHKKYLSAVPNDASPVTAVIGLNKNVDGAKIALPAGAELLYRFKYINAVSMKMPGSFAARMAQDDNITYISQDKYMYPSSETVPWGVTAIQATDPSVPPPDTSLPCFKVCIVDSGFSLGHVDLVCTKLFSAKS